MPKAVIQNIIRAVEQLQEHPYPVGVKKLVGTEHTYRLRVGDYRIVYKIVGEEVLILGIIHRKKVYDAIEKRA